jgi:hypothetical protein
VLQLDILYFLDGVLVETLAVAGDLDQFVELLDVGVHAILLEYARWSRHAKCR